MDLEDLNNLSNSEARRNRALALYEGTREDDLVNEEVDERILRLLGLEDVFDIDYSTYLMLLREKMAEARMVDKKLSTEESMILNDEYKKLKGKVGRFKLKRKKITAQNLGVSGPITISKQKYYLTEKVISPEVNLGSDETSTKSFLSINESLKRIVELLKSQNKLVTKSEDTERKRIEDEKRSQRESNLEKGVEKVTAVVSKVLAPVRGILDRILNFIAYTLLGRAFVKFVDWFNDPKNKEKVATLKRFLKDWWPSLLGAFILFATPFGKFVRFFIGTVTKLTYRLAKFAIPKLLSFTKSNPLIAAGAITGLAAGTGYMMEKGRMEEIEKKQGPQPKSNWFNELGKAFNPGQLGMSGIGGFRNGGVIPAFEGGGLIDQSTGMEITGAGPDTQLIAAKPGEIVIPTETVSKYGAPFFMNLIRSSGKSGIPKMVNNIQLARDGGMVGGLMSGFGRMFGTKTDTKSYKPSWHGPAPIYDHKTPQVKAILRALKAAEGTLKSKNSYDTVFGGKMMPIRQMTVRELVNTQMTDTLPKRFGGGKAPWPKGSVAAGAYQFMPNTLKQLMKMGVLNASDKMNQDTQDRAAWALMQRRGLNLDQLKSQGLSRGILNTLAPEWASLPTHSGKSYYSQPVKPAEFLQKVYNQSLKLGQQSKAMPPGPPVASSRSSFIQLPDVVQQTSIQSNSSSSTKVPQISDPITSTQRINASIYGIG